MFIVIVFVLYYWVYCMITFTCILHNIIVKKDLPSDAQAAFTVDLKYFQKSEYDVAFPCWEETVQIKFVAI